MRDAHGESGIFDQQSGIAQGCPLSPYLFIIMLSVLLTDVEGAVVRELGPLAQGRTCLDVAYADDTALISDDIPRLQLFLRTLVLHAWKYGLEPNWGKTVHLQVRHAAPVLTSTGDPVEPTSSALYLGGLLNADCNAGASLARRLGEARGALDKLSLVWSHANISQRRKIQLFNACVISKLTYSIEALCLRKAERDKLDAFQAQCLRKILKIPHSMISHVSNESVRQQARQHRLSSHILMKQLDLFGKLGGMPDSATRDAVFAPGSLNPPVLHGRRARGRPRLTWVRVMHEHASQACSASGTSVHVELGPVYSRARWRSIAQTYVF